MAKQKGLIKIKGTIGDLTFYKSRHGHIVREKTSIDGERIATDAAFVRTRENMSEFGLTAKSGKLLRDVLQPMMINAKDADVVSRLGRQLAKVKNLDATNIRGQRNVATALALPAAKVLLKGFNFNIHAVLGSLLTKPYTVNTGTGVISIPNLKPIDDIKVPKGATHVSIRSAWAKINFATGLYDIKFSNVVNLPINNTVTNVTLTPTAAATGTGNDLFLLRLEFFQQINGIQYILKNGTFNALSIAEVV